MDDVIVGITSTDVLMHLGAEETSGQVYDLPKQMEMCHQLQCLTCGILAELRTSIYTSIERVSCLVYSGLSVDRLSRLTQHILTQHKSVQRRHAAHISSIHTSVHNFQI